MQKLSTFLVIKEPMQQILKVMMFPLVPQYSLDTSLEWKITEFTIIIPTIKYQDDMRMESDDENFQDTKIPSYIVTNMSISSKFGKFFSTLSINNIFDEKIS